MVDSAKSFQMYSVFKANYLRSVQLNSGLSTSRGSSFLTPPIQNELESKERLSLSPLTARPHFHLFHHESSAVPGSVWAQAAEDAAP